MIDDSILQGEEIVANEYKITKVTKEDIVEQLGLPVEKQDVVKDIISNLENSVIDAIKVRNVAMLPYLGCIRYKPIQMALRPYYKDIQKFKKHFGKDLCRLEIKKVCHELYNRRIIYDDFKYDQYIKKHYADILNKYQKGWQNLFIWFRKSLIPITPTEE